MGCSYSQQHGQLLRAIGTTQHITLPHHRKDFGVHGSSKIQRLDVWHYTQTLTLHTPTANQHKPTLTTTTTKPHTHPHPNHYQVVKLNEA